MIWHMLPDRAVQILKYFSTNLVLACDISLLTALRVHYLKIVKWFEYLSPKNKKKSADVDRLKAFMLSPTI